MAGIDKAAIAFSIAIVAIGVGFAFYMGAVQDAGPVASAPVISERPVVTETQTMEKDETAAAAEAAAAEAAAAEAAAAEAAAAEAAAAEAAAAEAAAAEAAAAEAAAAEAAAAEAAAAEAAAAEAAAAEAAAAEAAAAEAAAAEAAAAEAAAAEAAAAGPQTHSVSIPMDSGISQDCVKTDECYIPYEVTINVGDTVTWINDDQLPHTVTAGDLEVDKDVVGTDYPNGFDSSIVLKDGTFSHTFETAGT